MYPVEPNVTLLNRLFLFENFNLQNSDNNIKTNKIGDKHVKSYNGGHCSLYNNIWRSRSDTRYFYHLFGGLKSFAKSEIAW